jgi:hypothetical protein
MPDISITNTRTYKTDYPIGNDFSTKNASFYQDFINIPERERKKLSGE